MITIKELKTLNTDELAGLKKLLEEYGDYMFNELKLRDGENSYHNDLQNFPGEKYLEEGGAFLLALHNESPAGCAALRKFDATSCEMKRMYVNSRFRGLKIGEKLCEEIIERAKKSGYKKILLDINKEMTEAVELYLKFNFKEIPPYCVNVNKHPMYFAKEL